jgi:hypothetical protein
VTVDQTWSQQPVPDVEPSGRGAPIVTLALAANIARYAAACVESGTAHTASLLGRVAAWVQNHPCHRLDALCRDPLLDAPGMVNDYFQLAVDTDPEDVDDLAVLSIARET